jgi:hypothetical protein
MAKKKNEAARALVALRWKGKTKAEKSEVAKGLNASRWANATPEERAAQGARLAASRAKAKAGGKKARKKATE